MPRDPFSRTAAPTPEELPTLPAAPPNLLNKPSETVRRAGAARAARSPPRSGLQLMEFQARHPHAGHVSGAGRLAAPGSRAERTRGRSPRARKPELVGQATPGLSTREIRRGSAWKYAGTGRVRTSRGRRTAGARGRSAP